MKIVDKVLEKEKIKQQNKENWITVKGNHIKLKDGETAKEATQRFVEEKQAKSESKKSYSEKVTGYKEYDPENAINITGDELGQYKDIKELRLKAKELGKITFTSRGYKKTISFSADERKLKLFPYLPEIIKNGKFKKEELHFNKINDNSKWWRLKASIILNGEKLLAGVNIREDENGKMYYDNFILDTNKGKELIQKQIRSPFANNSVIEESKYIVNLFIET